MQCGVGPLHLFDARHHLSLELVQEQLRIGLEALPEIVLDALAEPLLKVLTIICQRNSAESLQQRALLYK